MSDDVNSPGHYNKQGIEVIEVIEAYAKHDFRLANVIKYVCRCEYKGNKLKDLQKAHWYLSRVIEELAIAEKDTAYQAWREDAEEFLTFDAGPQRIAGDDPAATRIKDKYYRFDSDHMVGECRECGYILTDARGWLTYEGLKFCSLACMNKSFPWLGK